MPEIRPFKINVPDDALDHLHKKLELTDLPDEIDGVGWTHGAPLADIKRLTNYWRNGFDWKAQEAKLNEMPQFKTVVEVDGFGEVDMHFVHQKSDVVDAIPLLFVHGWPGSFIEVTKILPLLNNTRDGPAFHIVAPSLMNFGFSPRVAKEGLGVAQHAEALHKIMLALGYDQYVTQGGDWGFMITRALGHLYPKHVMALHTNMPVPNFPSVTGYPRLAAKAILQYTFPSLFCTPTEAASLQRAKTFRESGRGYSGMFSTRPQTMSYLMNDSPVGVLAWIYDKLHEWTDDYPWTDDEILTWISIYWFSEAGPGASGYIYKEFFTQEKTWGMAKLQTWVSQPLGFHYCPREIIALPRAWLATMGKVVFVGESDGGGHFATWERPQDIADDLKQMFGKKGGAYGVVKGKNGY